VEDYVFDDIEFSICYEDYMQEVKEGRG
jgi:hypothetical protein